MIATHERDYVAWQNRAFGFYLGARSLYNAELYAPAAYTASMALELLLKATLVYWDRTFVPTDGGHGMAKMTRMVKNKARGASSIEVAAYFYHEQRYLTVTRYPRKGKGLVIPEEFLDDLDKTFADLLLLVPFQHNTQLRRTLRERSRKSLVNLRRGNQQMRRLRRALGERIG